MAIVELSGVINARSSAKFGGGRALPLCCQELRVEAMALLFPQRHDAAGLEFIQAHGLEGLTLTELRQMVTQAGAGLVHIRHRCQHLQDDGLCAIYANRPAVCRAYDCANRADCMCGGKGNG